MELLEGACYVLEAEKPEMAFRVLREAVALRHACLCVTRLYPERARAQFGLPWTPFVWLTEVPGKDNQSPKSLTGLAERIETFIARSPAPAVVLLDGIEYLILQNEFAYVLAFVEHLVEFVASRRGSVLLPVNPRALTPRDLAQLERDLEVPDVEAWKDELDAREWSAQL